MRFILVAMLCVATNAHAEFVVRITEQRTSHVTTFAVDASAHLVRPIKRSSGETLPQVHSFETSKNRLIYGGSDIGAATELLSQCTVDGFDVAIVREEYNSFSNPLRILVAFSGHPIQVSKIKLIVVRDGHLVLEKELAREPSSYQWLAAVEH